MKIINPSIEVMHTGLEKDFMTPEQFIEKVGRTCYKSEDKITADSAVKFVGGLVKRGHEAMIEHWSLIFKTDRTTFEDIRADWLMLMHYTDDTDVNEPDEKRLKPFIRFTTNETKSGMRYVVSGNMRAWCDYMHAWTRVKQMDWIPYYLLDTVNSYPTFFPEYQEMLLPESEFVYENRYMSPITVNDLVGEFEHSVHHDVTVKFICDRGVSHEIVRHRTASFAQESTRYCNYSGDKYGNEITVVKPKFISDLNISLSDPAFIKNSDIFNSWRVGCECSERVYFSLLDAGSTPQEARSVLPNSLKTEVIMTGNLDCWKHFFELRCAPDAHPDIQVVAKMVREEFQRCGLIGYAEG